MEININRIIYKTEVEGPGVRYCIYVQGCKIRCVGCANQEMWDFDSGKSMDTETIIKSLKASKSSIEGITFLGGEPLDQAQAVLEIATASQAMGLSVVLFTGYLKEYLLQSKNDVLEKLFKNVDLLIDGPFIEEMCDYSRAWVGSSNQRYHFLTNRYSHLKDAVNDITNKFEVRVTKEGMVMVNGMGNYKCLPFIEM